MTENIEINDVFLCNPDLTFDVKFQWIKTELLKRGIDIFQMSYPVDLVICHGFKFSISAMNRDLVTVYPDQEFLGYIEEHKAVKVGIYQIKEIIDLEGYGRWRIRFGIITREQVLEYETNDTPRWHNEYEMIEPRQKNDSG